MFGVYQCYVDNVDFEIDSRETSLRLDIKSRDNEWKWVITDGDVNSGSRNVSREIMTMSFDDYDGESVHRVDDFLCGLVLVD